MEQTCKKCQYPKDIEAFAKGKNKNGRHPWCRECFSAYGKTRRNLPRPAPNAPARAPIPCLYIVENPAWRGWVKVGLATPRGKEKNLESRMLIFNMATPHKDFRLVSALRHPEAGLLEPRVHAWLAERFPRGAGNSEWFACTVRDVQEALKAVLPSVSTL